MKKLILSLISLVTILSCSEGDSIDADVNFDAEMSSCGNTSANTFVFYKIDNAARQVLSFGFTSTSFELNKTFEEPQVIALNNTTNRLLYRELNAQIEGTSYFCNSIPPAETNIVNELVSENGTATITYEKVEGSDTEYTRTLTLENVTLRGNGISIRKEVFGFGSEVFEVPQ